MTLSRQRTATRPFLPRLAAAVLATGLAAPLALADHHAFVEPTDPPQVEWGPCPEFMPEGCAIAVLQGNPAEANADVLFKLPAGTTAPAHWHTSAERMVLISGEMEVQYEGQQPATLHPGTYAYGPAELTHHATCNSEADCVLFIAFEEPVDAFAAEE